MKKCSKCNKEGVSFKVICGDCLNSLVDENTKLREAIREAKGYIIQVINGLYDSSPTGTLTPEQQILVDKIIAWHGQLQKALEAMNR